MNKTFPLIGSAKGLLLSEPLTLVSQDTKPWTDVCVTLEGEMLEPQELRIPEIKAGETRPLPGLAPMPTEAAQLGPEGQTRECVMVISVRIGEELVLQQYETLEIELHDPYALHFDEGKAAGQLTKQDLWERKLLDFSLRNNLLNCKAGKRVIPFVSYDIDKIEDRVQQNEDFSILPKIENVTEARVKEEIEKNHLVSFLTEAELKTQLKFIYRSSRNALEENGANTLFLALGMLKWYETEKSTTERNAPILLLPVDILRKSGNNFIIRSREEDVILNNTLTELLRQQFRIDLRALNPLPTDASGVDVKRILEMVRSAIQGESRWEVKEQTLLGLFSFNKFVMWNDIHSHADQLAGNQVIRSLMEGRVALDGLDEKIDAREIDKTVKPSEFVIPMDVDSSQMEAVIESGKGRSFILYGPPGTGKSQTITNMIANALYHDKRVLFVAEKMAALTVVQKRLAKIGLDPFCLELHSNKVTKQHFLQQMQKVLDVTKVAEPADYQRQSDELFETRQKLIHYMEALHTKHDNGLSLWDCLSRYLELPDEEIRQGLPGEINDDSIHKWVTMLADLDKVFQLSGHPADSRLKGLYPKSWSQEAYDRIDRLLPQWKEAWLALDGKIEPQPEAWKGVDAAARLKELKEIAGKWFLPKFFAKRSFLTGLREADPGVTWESASALLDRIGKVNRYYSLLSDLQQLAFVDTEARPEDMDRWMENLTEMKSWCQWTERRKDLVAAGLQCVVDYIESHPGTTADAARDAYLKGIYHRETMQLVDKEPDLRMFNGLLFEEIIARYREQTRQFQEVSKQELYCKLAAKVPSQTLAAAQGSEMGILKKNIGNGGRGTSIRKIIDQIPSLLPKLCPVWLMSPISVAQFLDLNNEKFDLVIFDEASQMPTSEAVGAIARGTNLICVGDPKQMPPTSFFETANTDEESSDIEDMDSILDDCIALSMPGHVLKWHYRSKHESLIAFSNQEYYDHSLYTFPSVDDRQVKVSLVQLEGTYDKGQTRSNPTEAKAIVDEVIRRLKDPELSKRSIGIVSFSKVQQNLIEDMLTDELARHPDLEAKANGGEEPIFVKNLENVQGDERDVILFSVGYGPDKSGKVSMNFGPLNNEGGERRLNVAVSRAKYEMKVFSILRPEQIDLNRSKAKGVAGLKAFLEFARSGRLGGSSLPKDSSLITHHSSLVEQIAAALRAHGYEVDTNVGRSNFKIDLAVIDPQTGNYILGILCDGENYFNTPTTRDREICQPNVLNMLHWKQFRVWSIDWWEDREKVVRRILDVLEGKERTDSQSTPSTQTTQSNQSNPSTQNTLRSQSSVDRTYRAAKIARKKLPETFDPTRGSIATYFRQAVETLVTEEAPVTNTYVQARLKELTGYAMTQKVRAYVDLQLSAYYRDPLSDEQVSVWWKDKAQADSYTGFRTDSDREADEIPVVEVINVMRTLIEEQGAMPDESLIKATLHTLGFARRTPKLDALIEKALPHIKR